jgi:hypothetical protein
MAAAQPHHRKRETLKRRKPRKSFEQIAHERMQDNRTREVQGLFNQFEADAVRERLSIDAATRERQRQELLDRAATN